MSTRNEKDAITSIAEYCEKLYLSGINMLLSRSVFNEFLYVEIKLYAELIKVDFKKAADAYIKWASIYHSKKYEQIEEEGINIIIGDCEGHYNFGPNMFSSKSAFDEFLNKEVRFHANLERVDFQKAADAYMKWARTYHAAEYDKISSRLVQSKKND